MCGAPHTCAHIIDRLITHLIVPTCVQVCVCVCVYMCMCVYVCMRCVYINIFIILIYFCSHTHERYIIIIWEIAMFLGTAHFSYPPSCVYESPCESLCLTGMYVCMYYNV